MIRKLAPHIVHQIAAGEVIERPASALKELIENSLDAGASKLTIRFEGGGLKLLQVEDNGKGISADDMPLAFEAHATSKLQELSDFAHLSSFGFRGEALSSMAAIADLEIWSTAESESIGTKARVAYGISQPSAAADRRIGTSISLRNIFQQIPARLKFLKSERSEGLQLMTVFRRYALAYPEVSFSISDLGSQRTQSLNPESALERTLWFFDSQNAEDWFSISGELDGWKLSGFVIKPKAIGKVRSGISTYLNRRPFKDSKLEFAVKRAFEGFTLFPRDLSSVLFLEGPPEEFDVNVSPTKMDVRFQNPERIFSLIVRSIRPHLEVEHLPEPIESRVTSVETPLILEEVSEVVASTMLSKPEVFEFRPTALPQREFQPTTTFAAQSFSPSIENRSQVFQFSNESLNSFEYLGSIDETYLLARRKQDLWIFDQHALHERILYERHLKVLKEGGRLESQRLLFPIVLKFENASALLEQEELLHRLGFEVREWNDSKIHLISAPAVLKRDHDKVLCRLVEGREGAEESLLRDLIATLACHSAVRAHDRISREEIDRLFKDFQSEDALGHCPHGRPTFVRFEGRDLEKMFHRVV